MSPRTDPDAMTSCAATLDASECTLESILETMAELDAKFPKPDQEECCRLLCQAWSLNQDGKLSHYDYQLAVDSLTPYVRAPDWRMPVRLDRPEPESYLGPDDERSPRLERSKPCSDNGP